MMVCAIVVVSGYTITIRSWPRQPLVVHVVCAVVVVSGYTITIRSWPRQPLVVHVVCAVVVVIQLPYDHGHDSP